MSELLKNHSSGLFTFTRVKSQKKTPKTTVGITLSPQLLAEARKRNLNISRITEQALSSILKYLAQQNECESSISLNACSLPRENAWARSSVRLERRTLNP